MKRLTAKEEEIMGFFWKEGPMFVKQLLPFYSEPRPHFNTLSTIVRGLEEKGFLAHKAYGNTYEYYPLILENEFKKAPDTYSLPIVIRSSHFTMASMIPMEMRQTIMNTSQHIH